MIQIPSCSLEFIYNMLLLNSLELFIRKTILFQYINKTSIIKFIYVFYMSTIITYHLYNH